MQPFVRDRSRDIIIRMIPLQLLRHGASCGAAILLALLKLFFGCVIKPNIAITGVVGLIGYVLPVAKFVAKARAALEYGAVLVVIPSANEQEARNKLTPQELSQVRFISHVVELLAYAVDGKFIGRRPTSG